MTTYAVLQKLPPEALDGDEGRYGMVDVLATTDELVRLDKQLGFHRRGISDPGGDEVVHATYPMFWSLVRPAAPF